MQSNQLFYPNGSLYADIQDEVRRYFYQDGTLKTSEPYRNGKLHGEVVLYWPNGKEKRKSHFCDGIREGLDAIWSENGQLVDEGNYEQGKPIGIHRRWNRKGDRIEEIEYIDSARFNFRQWDEAGQLRCEGTWTDDLYFEKTWHSLEMKWIEKQGRWDGKKLIFI